MRINRQKKINKQLNFYCNTFGFRRPFRVLIDGTFCQAALKSKVKLSDQIPMYLGEDVKLLTTPCAIMETESLGSQVYGAMFILKQFPVHHCGHKTPIPAATCIKTMVKPKNEKRYIVATQDRLLQTQVRQIPCTPLLYIHNKAPTLEPPSPATLIAAQKQIRKTCDLSSTEKEALTQFKTAVFGEPAAPSPRKRKRKGPKGPNPLSCKKKKSEIGKSKKKKKKKKDKKSVEASN